VITVPVSGSRTQYAGDLGYARVSVIAASDSRRRES
jgi:hypothetical protein